MPGMMNNLKLDDKKMALKDLIKALARMPQEDKSPELSLEGSTSVEKASQDVPAEGQSKRVPAPEGDDDVAEAIEASDKADIESSMDSSEDQETKLNLNSGVKLKPSLSEKYDYDDLSLEELQALKKKMKEKGIL